MHFEIDDEFIAERNEKMRPEAKEEYDHLAAKLHRKNIDIENLTNKAESFRVAVPSWGVGTAVHALLAFLVRVNHGTFTKNSRTAPRCSNSFGPLRPYRYTFPGTNWMTRRNSGGSLARKGCTST